MLNAFDSYSSVHACVRACVFVCVCDSLPTQLFDVVCLFVCVCACVFVMNTYTMYTETVGDWAFRRGVRASRISIAQRREVHKPH